MKFAKFAWQENNERRQKKDRKKVGEMANFQQKEVTKKRERECVCVCVCVCVSCTRSLPLTLSPPPSLSHTHTQNREAVLNAIERNGIPPTLLTVLSTRETQRKKKVNERMNTGSRASYACMCVLSCVSGGTVIRERYVQLHQTSKQVSKQGGKQARRKQRTVAQEQRSIKAPKA